MSEHNTDNSEPAPTRNLRKPWSLKGKIAVVTGAAGGIGSATAFALAKKGCKLTLVDLDINAAEKLKEQLEDEGVEALVVAADVRDVTQVETIYKRTIDAFGDVHVMMNNAGILRVGGALETSDESWKDVIDVNFWGTVHGCRVFGRHFQAQGCGHIVNTASAAGLSGLPYSASYSSSKFAVVGLSESLRWELAQYGVGVSVVCPGAVKSGIAKGSGGPRTAELVDKFGLSAGPLGKRIVKAIEKDRARVMYGFEPLMWSSMRWLSSSLHDQAGKKIARIRREKQLF